MVLSVLVQEVVETPVTNHQPALAVLHLRGRVQAKMARWLALMVRGVLVEASLANAFTKFLPVGIAIEAVLQSALLAKIDFHGRDE